MVKLELAHTIIELDEDGFLAHYDQWSKEVAEALAEREGIGALTAEHMHVLDTIRGYYDKFNVAPMVHLLARDCGKTYRDLHRLFKKQPGKRAAKLAGLSKSKGCV